MTDATSRNLPALTWLRPSTLSLWLLWLSISLLLCAPRVTHPAFGAQGDLPLHYYIAQSYARSFAEGDALPRWAGLLDGGRGDALFTFYPPLCYFMGAVFSQWLKLSALDALKLVTLLALLVAQASAYLFARAFFARRLSLLVSLAYVLLPTYPLIGLHRAFLANALALSLTPLALLGAHRLLLGERSKSGFIIFTLALSALILTHAITTYLCGLLIGLLLLVFWPRAQWPGVLRLAGAGLGVLALTAFFLWPQSVEVGWVQLRLQLVQQDYRNYFLFAAAPDASEYRQAWADVNNFTSYLTIIQSLTALLLWLLCRPRWRRDRLSPLIWFALAVAAFGLLISLPISAPLWRWLPGLKFIQFPWRFQPLVALACGLLGAAAVECRAQLRGRPKMLLTACLTWLVVINLIFTVMVVYLHEPQLTRAQVAQLLASPNTPPLPITEARRLQNTGDLNYLPYSANQIYFRPHGADFNLYGPATQPGGIAIIHGTGTARALRLEVAHREFELTAAAPTVARIETYAYPHWVARLDGREVATRAESGSGLVLMDVPAGTHRLRLDWEVRQPGQRIARWVSALAWMIFVAWLARLASKQLRRRRAE